MERRLIAVICLTIAVWLLSQSLIDSLFPQPPEEEKVAEVDMPLMHISTYSLAETFDVGCDTGTQVDPTYEGSPFAFTGALDKVVITLTDPAHAGQVPPDEFID